MRLNPWKCEVWRKNKGMRCSMYFCESDDKMGAHIRKRGKHFLEVRTCTEKESRHQGYHLWRLSGKKNVLWLEWSRHIWIAITSSKPAVHSLTPSHPLIHLPTYPHVHLCLSTHLLIYLPITTHINPSVHLPTHLSIHSPTLSFIKPSTHLSLSIIHSSTSIHLPTYPSIHSLIHSAIQLSTHLPALHSSSHPFNWLVNLSCISAMHKALRRCWRGWRQGWS